VNVEEKLHWFWAAGFLPGSMFDDWNERVSKSQALVHSRRLNWLGMLGLRRTHRGFARTR
jgi:hypothetical protein